VEATDRPSPLRRLLPPLIWPAGLLLLVGYCYVDDRTDARRSASIDRNRQAPSVEAIAERSPSTVVDRSSSRVSSVAVAMDPPMRISLPLILIVVLGTGLWVSVLRRPAAAPPDHSRDS
jgi:hypothetical protein